MSSQSNQLPETRYSEIWLTIPQVAEMFQVKPSTVRNWINETDSNKTQLEATKLGNHWRINKQDALNLGKRKYGITERSD